MEQKSFWQRPEGITGALLLTGIVAGGLWWLNSMLPTIIALASNTLYLSAMLAALAGVVYMVLDPKMRNLVWYLYTSFTRWITGLFVQINPIGILKSYISDLEKNLKNLSKQIGALRGQMRQLKGTMDTNNADIQKNLTLANKSKQTGDDKNTALSARKAGRLQEANAKYEVLYNKMEVMYRILTRMYENSEIMLDDTRDQVNIKEQEYKAIKASHSAIQSAQSILKGSPDQRAMFDLALEALATDVSTKVGEMERFMDTSRNLMDTIDLQNGVFEEDGLRLLEQWERESPLLASNEVPLKGKSKTESLDISKPPKEPLKDNNDYHQLFD